MSYTEIHNIISAFDNLGILPHSLPNAIGLWENEQECLAELALKASDSDWVEIGAFCGGSTCLLGLTRKFRNIGPKLISVDLDLSKYGMFRYNVFERAKLQEIVFPLEINSSNLNKYLCSDVSLLFIDGFHSFKQVIKDFEEVYPFLTKDAIIIFHDVSPNFENSYESFRQAGEYYIENFNKLNNDNSENFRIDEAIVHIMNKYLHEFEFMHIEAKKDIQHFKETGLTSWVRGTTSPFNAMTAIRRRNES